MLGVDDPNEDSFLTESMFTYFLCKKMFNKLKKNLGDVCAIVKGIYWNLNEFSHDFLGKKRNCISWIDRSVKGFSV